MKERITGVINRNIVKGAVAEVAARVFTEVIPIGADNLKSAREISKKGGKLILMANHLSNADAPVVALALKIAGFADLSDKLVFLLGRRLVENKVIRWGIDAYSHIVVWPPTMIPRTEEEKKRAYATTKLSLAAARGAQEAGRILVIFPEGTRSRQHQLAKGTPAIANYLERDDTYVVPVGISGVEKVLPVGAFFPTWGAVEVGFGEVINHDEFSSKLKNTPRGESKSRIIDGYMNEIAELIHPQYRGVYTVKEAF